MYRRARTVEHPVSACALECWFPSSLQCSSHPARAAPVSTASAFGSDGGCASRYVSGSAWARASRPSSRLRSGSARGPAELPALRRAHRSRPRQDTATRRPGRYCTRRPKPGRERRRGEITLINRAAARLLNATPEDARRPALFRSRARTCRPHPPRHERRARPRRGPGGCEARRRRAPPERAGLAARRARPSHGFVVTFDDITDLVSAQRTAAWAEVARRIAHEIKNPLTPIQLSAERLKRKYAERSRHRSRDLRPVHRHHHPPGGRHRPHGGRVLVLRAHAGAVDQDRAMRRNWCARRCSCSAWPIRRSPSR